MAIRQHYAERIYTEHKRFEFRRVRPRFDIPVKVYVYEPSPIRLITGHFHAVALFDVDAYLNEYEADPQEAARIAQYLSGAKRPTAIQIGSAQRLPDAVTLAAVGIAAAPQSYVYANLV